MCPDPTPLTGVDVDATGDIVVAAAEEKFQVNPSPYSTRDFYSDLRMVSGEWSATRHSLWSLWKRGFLCSESECSRLSCVG